MSSSKGADQTLFSFEETRRAQARIEKMLKEASFAEGSAARRVRVLDDLARTAVELQIFSVREDLEHADLVKKYQAIIDHLDLMERAIEPARRALRKWRQHY
jgi:hypothetical protein